MADEIRSYGPGKFSTLVDEAVYGLSLDGPDETLAEEGFGSRTLLRGGLLEAMAYASVPLNSAENDFLSRQVGCVLTETTDGTVQVDYYDDPEVLEGAWADVQADFETFAGSEESMDPGDHDTPHSGDDIPLP